MEGDVPYNKQHYTTTHGYEPEDTRINFSLELRYKKDLDYTWETKGNDARRIQNNTHNRVGFHNMEAHQHLHDETHRITFKK